MPISNRSLRWRLVPRRVGIFTAAIFATSLLGGPALAQNYTPPPPADRPPPPPPPARSDNPGLVDEIQKLLKTPSSLLPSTSLLPSFGSDSKDAPPPNPPPPPPPSPASPPASSQAASPPPPPPPGGRPPPPPPAPAASSAPIVPSMVSGRQVCPAAPGSGADCQAAADILCRSKGYGGGKSLGVDATEKCSAKVLIPGRAREPGDCRTENFVTRAWCQ